MPPERNFPKGYHLHFERQSKRKTIEIDGFEVLISRQTTVECKLPMKHEKQEQVEISIIACAWPIDPSIQRVLHGVIACMHVYRVFVSRLISTSATRLVRQQRTKMKVVRGHPRIL